MSHLRASSALITSFGAGYLTTALIDSYRQGKLATSLEPLNDLTNVLPLDKLKQLAVYSSPIALSGVCFVSISRTWQALSASMAITSANPVMGRIFGLTGIALAGAYTAAAVRFYVYDGDDGRVKTSGDIFRLPMTMSSNMTIAKDVAVAISVFTLLGGSWRHLVPSSVLYRGSFSNSKLLALLSQRTLVNGKSRDVVSTICSYSGCHSCGTRRGPFVADLTPPTAVVEKQQKFFVAPTQDYITQCWKCAKKQELALTRWQNQSWYERQLMGHSAVTTHFSSFRLHDLTGVALGLLITPIIY